MKTTARRVGIVALFGLVAAVIVAYLYGLGVWLTTDRRGFPHEDGPPEWAWPAVVATAVLFVPLAVSLAVAVPRLRRTWWFRLSCVASVAVLLLAVGWVVVN